MKTELLLIAFLLSSFFIQAQNPQQMLHRIDTLSSLQLSINTMSLEQTAKINNYISHQKNRGVFVAALGKSLLESSTSSVSNIIINEIVKLTQIRKKQKEEWNLKIQNECHFVDSLSYIDNQTDFYSKGSFNGALDPEGLRFNGFNLKAKRDGEDVLRFYCHVDTEESGLNEIYNHSKFRLVLDSLFFYPYKCHLPNLYSNHMAIEASKECGRKTHFNFEDRENLVVSLQFTITSSWYNEAIILAKDVELGTFSIQIPISEEHLKNGVFIYKSGMPNVLHITGDCFIVPRSYVALPGGESYWGTGEYNVTTVLAEQCNITESMRKNWKNDYRQMKKMEKGSRIGSYFVNLYNQNGPTVVRSLLEATSKTALDAAGISSGAGANRSNGNPGDVPK